MHHYSDPSLMDTWADVWNMGLDPHDICAKLDFCITPPVQRYTCKCEFTKTSAAWPKTNSQMGHYIYTILHEGMDKIPYCHIVTVFQSTFHNSTATSAYGRQSVKCKIKEL